MEKEKGSWTFQFIDHGRDRTVRITADNLLEARDIFYRNFGEKTSVIINAD